MSDTRKNPAPICQLVRISDDDFPVVIMEQRGDSRIGERRDERPERLERSHPDPSALVAQEVDEERREFRLSDLGRTDAGNGHEDVGACLAYTPDTVFAEVEELGQLKQETALSLKTS